MNTFNILINSIAENNLLRIWNLTQIAYCHNRIKSKQLEIILRHIKVINPNFFISTESN